MKLLYCLGSEKVVYLGPRIPRESNPSIRCPVCGVVLNEVYAWLGLEYGKVPYHAPKAGSEGA